MHRPLTPGDISAGANLIGSCMVLELGCTEQNRNFLILPEISAT